MSNPELIIEAAGVTRTYRVGTAELNVLRGVDYQVQRGRWACLLGASGSGKTTLLNILGALEKPTAGTIRVGGVDLSALSRRSAAHFRNRSLGFVFQAYHLLPELSMLENVMLPGLLAGNSRSAAPRERRRSAGESRTLRPVETPPVGTFRRRTAARFDRARSDQ